MHRAKPNVIQLALAVGLALLCPFLLPPHVVGVYIPLGSLLFGSEVWHAEPDSIFYSVFFVEWIVYSALLYLVFRLLSKLTH